MRYSFRHTDSSLNTILVGRWDWRQVMEISIQALSIFWHQIALARKQLLFFFDEHWSTLVRLAHLFEIHSFRTQFHRALLKVISVSFQYRWLALPADDCDWRIAAERLTCYKTAAAVHMAMVQFDLHTVAMWRWR